jgi:hypothetical protein
MNTYYPIPTNPYIVGNPIMDKEMFFGREEDFQFIRDNFLKQQNGLILTLAGERRSGKTSILFQILNGRLGEGFMPIFIDMQAMAGIESTSQFLGRIAYFMSKDEDETVIPAVSDNIEPDEFEFLINKIQQLKDGSRIIFMIDEYEIIEKKIDEGKISPDITLFCSRLMEKFNVMFLFTGSNNLENRNAPYWKVFLSKSCFRRIPYLNEIDCNKLITKPLGKYISYSGRQLEKIFRLTAGHPFYTQNICQILVDHLITNRRNIVFDNDIDSAISEILASPIHQMIYYWQDFSRNQMKGLSLLGHLLNEENQTVEIKEIIEFLKKNGLKRLITDLEIRDVLKEMCNKAILIKSANGYCFRMDFFRSWIRQEQSIWKLVGELGY